MRRRTYIIITAIAVIALLAYGLMPLADARHEIVFNADGIARKEEFLAETRKRDRHDAPRPNIVVILADDLGKTDISLYRDDAVPTPNIDAIAARGAVFMEAYASSAICSPSRAALLTGRYQERFGFETQPNNRYPRNRIEYYAYSTFMSMGDFRLSQLDSVPRNEDILLQGIPPSELTLSELLQAEGYATYIAGKWHLGHAEPFQPTQRGFDASYGFYEAFTLYAPEDDPNIVEYRHDYFANKHIWAQGRDGLCAIRRDEKIIDEKDYLTFAIADEGVEFVNSHKEEPFFLYLPFSAPHTPFQAPRAYYDRFSDVDDENKRVYYAMIAALDDAVGQVVEAIDGAGLTENTIIWFASDNGGATYTGATDNTPLNGGKFNHFEGGVNIPMAVQWPGVIPEGAVFNHPVSLMDIFATSAAITNAPLPADTQLDGADIIPHLTGETDTPPHDAIFWRAGHMKAARVGDWKLILDTRTGRTYLYNLETDKSEKLNVAANHPEVVNEIKTRLNEWEATLAPPRWPHLAEHHFTINNEPFDYPL